MANHWFKKFTQSKIFVIYEKICYIIPDICQVRQIQSMVIKQRMAFMPSFWIEKLCTIIRYLVWLSLDLLMGCIVS